MTNAQMRATGIRVFSEQTALKLERRREWQTRKLDPPRGQDPDEDQRLYALYPQAYGYERPT